MKQFCVTDYGAVPDSADLQTKAFQTAINACKQAGEGEILVPTGRYTIGSLRLWSNMTLHLLENVTLCGSKNYKDYTDFHVPTTMQYVRDPHFIKAWNLPAYYIYAILCAFGEQNVAIVGDKGAVIDGQDCTDPNGEEKFRGPMGIALSQCENVTLRGYRFRNSGNWSHQIDGCRNVDIDSVSIQAGHDGFNLHHCTQVKVRDCHLETGDDCVAGYDVEELTVERCYFNTACNSLRFGGSHVAFDHCQFEGPGHYPHISEGTKYTHALFKYYAIGPDVIRQDANDIVLKSCTFRDVTRLFVYEWGNKTLMHDNRPLRDFAIEDAEIVGLTKCSDFLGNGEPALLRLKNVRLLDVPTDFLRIDDAVSLVLDHVTSKTPTVIRAGKNSAVTLKNCENISIEK